MIFALCIVFWLVTEGKLDFSLIVESFSQFEYLALSLGLLFVRNFIAIYRWKIILETRLSKALSFIGLIRVHWIGVFFNSFLPGTVSGDIVKLFYARDLEASLSKTFLMLSIIIDRILGLAGLVLLMGIVSLVNYEFLVSFGPKMETILWLNFFIFLVVITSLSLLFIPLTWIYSAVKAVGKIDYIGSVVLKSYQYLQDIGKDKKTLILCILLSIFAQVLHVFAFLTIVFPFCEKTITFAQAFSLIPLGDLTIAVPIVPSGLGIGHVAFQFLFETIGINNGANLFNLYFMAMILVNLLGIIPYLLAGKKHSFAKI